MPYQHHTINHELKPSASRLFPGQWLASYLWGVDALRGYRIIMQCGHACFSIGETLEDAYQWVWPLEEVCDIILRH